ncbi:MAG: transcriptional repressor, partial [Actinobacteria bacterium]|nr:transcriptional repressor [Actinomycetota bacterium]
MNDLTELEPYFKRIVENGFRLTKCRKVILITIANALRSKSIKDETGTKEELDKTPLEKKGSFTADRLYSMVKERDPNIGLASVYRNLRLFEELGIIEKVGLEKDKVQYRFKRNNLVTSDHPSEIAIT